MVHYKGQEIDSNSFVTKFCAVILNGLANHFPITLECVQQYVRVHALIYSVFKFLHSTYLSFVQF